MIDVYPQREQLANITGAAITGTGGSPYNLLVNLAKLGVDIPLAAAGLVGNDAFGNLILDEVKFAKLETDQALRRLPDGQGDLATGKPSPGKANK